MSRSPIANGDVGRALTAPALRNEDGTNSLFSCRVSQTNGMGTGYVLLCPTSTESTRDVLVGLPEPEAARPCGRDGPRPVHGLVTVNFLLETA
jgi:hypothetical protein